MKAMQEKMYANQAKTDANEERMNVNLRKMKEEMKSTVSAIQEKMDAWIAEMKDGRKEKTARQETTEACLDSKEPNPEAMQSGGEHRKVPKEHAAVKPIGGQR
jgi:phage host-nuclease inhibitor protein Gam